MSGTRIAVDARRVAGYEYHYGFSADDEIVKLYKFEHQQGKRTYLFEIRTSFIMKTIDGEDTLMDSERFDAKVYGEHKNWLLFCVLHRLADYWMTKDEMNELVHKAFDFAIQTANGPKYASKWLIPIVVNLEVCTVQQEGETVDYVKDRAIREQKLIPHVLCPRLNAVDRKNFHPGVLYDLRRLMDGSLTTRKVHPGKIRVEDVGEGLVFMPVCNICYMGPLLGTFISILPQCDHAFHSHCITRRMLLDKNSRCPTCQVRVYPYTEGGIKRKRQGIRQRQGIK